MGGQPMSLASGDKPVSSDTARPSAPRAADGVSGTVRDGRGRPVAGVLVEASAEPGSPPVPDLAIVTDQAGRFDWPLRPGTYRLSAGPSGTAVRVTVRAGSAAHVDLVTR